MSAASPSALWDLIVTAGLPPHRVLNSWQAQLPLHRLSLETTLDRAVESFDGQTVLIFTAEQLATICALAELDGIARQLVFCPSGISMGELAEIATQAGANVILTDMDLPDSFPAIPIARCGQSLRPIARRPIRSHVSEWLLLTSGTTGQPKLVVHTLSSLTAPMRDCIGTTAEAVWCTFYDIRRYGGLQILLRALLGGGSIVLSDSREPVAEFLQRAGAARVTHISGTPTHWRRALMSGAAEKINPAYIRLSGELADQAILNNLHHAFPNADISHAYASTEAGVAFDVRDRLAGFPEALIGSATGMAELRVIDGTLRIRSARAATRYANLPGTNLTDAEGFIDTGDIVQLRKGRYCFMGRRGGQINVGGRKVHPEEVEAVLNLHPAVQMSRVKARPSPITGAIVVADILLKQNDVGDQALRQIKEEILDLCKTRLAAHKVPAMLLDVPALPLTAAGKLLRINA
jgi:acyl-CoA synthetase (AMP-forming)/AMP-acid ligase II